MLWIYLLIDGAGYPVNVSLKLYQFRLSIYFFFIPDRSLSTQTAAHVSRSLKPLILGSALVGYGVYKYMNTEQTVGLFPAVSAAGVPESQPSVSLRKRVLANLFIVFSEIEL